LAGRRGRGRRAAGGQDGGQGGGGGKSEGGAQQRTPTQLRVVHHETASRDPDRPDGRPRIVRDLSHDSTALRGSAAGGMPASTLISRRAGASCQQRVPFICLHGPGGAWTEVHV